MSRDLIPLTSYDQVPDDMTEAEAREFWDTHQFTEEYIASMPPISEDDFPPTGQLRKYGPIRLDRETFRKARWLARQRGISIEELIDALVDQALAARAERVRVPST
jgi:hypothetical protein